MYGLAPIGYLSGAGLKVTESSRGGGRRVSQRDFNGNQTLRRGPRLLRSRTVGLYGHQGCPLAIKEKKKKSNWLTRLGG